MARIGGYVYSVGLANPAAGADFFLRPPVGKMWEVLALSFLLTTGVTVANRCVGLAIEGPSGAALGLWRSGVLQTASLARDYTAPANAMGDPQGTTHILVPVPRGLRLGSNAWDVRSATHGLQPTDQYSNIRALVEEWTI